MPITDVRTRSEVVVGSLWRPSALGAVGALGVALTTSRIGSVPRPPGYRWWLSVSSGRYEVAHVLFYASVSLLIVGWLGVGVHARRGQLSVAGAWRILLLWGVPLVLGPPIFSRDLYSYIAQGQLVRHGLNPYLVAPRALGSGPLFASIARVWRDTPSPYGPLFVAITHVGAVLGGGSLIHQVLIFRGFELIGVGLLMWSLPAVARRVGTDPGVALWLGVLSPLALFSAVSSAHNDTLMLGLMMTALAASLHGARRWALVLFALGATIKLPALAGVVFIAGAQLRASEPTARARLLAEAVAIPAAVIIAVTTAAGLGWTWLSPSALQIPTQLRVLTTPVVSVGYVIAAAAHALGLAVSSSAVVSSVQHLSELAALVLVGGLVVRSRPSNVVRLLGLALLIVALASPTLWPWYLLWGLSVLATTRAQCSWFLVAIGAGAMLLVGPGGTPMIGGDGYYVSGPLVLASLVWYIGRRPWREVFEGPT